MKQLITLLIAIVFLSFYNCSENSPDSPPIATGKFIITSTPAGARIYLKGDDTGQNTPHTFNDIETGNYDGYLYLEYFDTAYFAVTILENLRTTEDITLHDNTPFIQFAWDYRLRSGGDSVQFNFEINQDILLDSILVFRPVNTSGTYTTDKYIYDKKLLVWRDQLGNLITYYLPPEESAQQNYPKIVNKNYRIDVHGHKAHGNQEYFNSFYSQTL